MIHAGEHFDRAVRPRRRIRGRIARTIGSPGLPLEFDDDGPMNDMTLDTDTGEKRLGDLTRSAE